jgi:hypothetical protein
VQDTRALQAVGEIHHLVVELSTDDAAVIGERFVARVYALQHSSLTSPLSCARLGSGNDTVL